ncbi:MAG: glutamate--tRNA ligase [Bacilli bacterium]|nr:glutamate--tRNA ligase [Bacilli bacterium]
MNKVRTRFAPSPTGFLHVGGLRTALYAYLYAKQNGGDFILRIEDTDLERFVPGAVEAIYKALDLTGIKPDEGPNEGGAYGPYVQTQRKEIYLKYAKELIEKGAAYYCFCDKERLDSLVNENGFKRYDKHCLHLSKEEIEEKLASGVPYVIRQNINNEGVSSFEDMVYGHVEVPNNELEDQILIKSDGLPTYNFANVVDDHLMGITHVIRGNEYLSSTPKYNLLYDAFGWERPFYMHVTPIMRDETHKLSKRYGDANFEDFIEKGYLPEAIINYIALVGWSPKGEEEKFTLEQLIEKFSVDGISKSSSIFDAKKMRWLNGEYIKELPFDKFMEYATPFFESSSIAGKYDYVKFGKLLQSRIEIFSEIEDKVKFIVNFKKFDPVLYLNKKFKIDLDVARTVIKASIPVFNDIKDWKEDNLHAATLKVAEMLGAKSGQVYSVLRVALSGVEVTPGGSVEIADILGKEESMDRLNKSLNWLEDNDKVKEQYKVILEACLATGASFGELFIEDSFHRTYQMANGELANANSENIHGVGIRILNGVEEVYGYTNNTSFEEMLALAKKLASSFNGEKKVEVAPLQQAKLPKIVEIKKHPNDVKLEEKVALMKKANDAAMVEGVIQSITRLTEAVQDVTIVNSNGTFAHDNRCNIRIAQMAIASNGTDSQQAGEQYGMNQGYELFDNYNFTALGKKVGENAVAMLSAEDIAGGKMTVVIDNAFGGVILHEACVHSLEATSVARGLSVFCGKLGQKIANDCVTAVDDGTMNGEWGSLNCDDEGNLTHRNVLIENGVLKSYLVDYRNSFRMNHPITGSGRRESYKYSPTSRMTNTFFAPGKYTKEEIIASVKDGFFAAKMGGGSVNPSTGEFNFAVQEGYLIKDGKLTTLIKGATLIGSGAEVLMNVDMIANDNFAMATGMCGSLSGSIPTNVGQPTIRVQNITVGGRK